MPGMFLDHFEKGVWDFRNISLLSSDVRARGGGGWGVERVRKRSLIWEARSS